MSEVLEFAHAVSPSNDRRQHARQRLRSLTYAELDQGNGGIVLDASESGISVHAVVPLTDDVIPRLRLKLPDASAWLETRARVIWTLDSGKVAGLQFEDLPEPARDQIREWLSSEALASEGEAGYPAAPTEHDVQPAPLDSHIQGARAGTEPDDVANNIGHGDGTPEVLPEIGDCAALDNRNALEPVARREAKQNTATAPSKPAAAAVTVAATNPQPVAKAVERPAKRPAPSPAVQISQPKFVTSESRHTASVFVLLLLLAVISLTSGWAAGRGKLRPMVEQFQRLIARADASGPIAALAAERPLPAVDVIEIVDANSQRRTISSTAGPRTSQAATVKPKTLISEPQPSQKSAVNFQIWTLSPPQRSVTSGNAGAIQSGAPPVVDGGKSPQDIAPVTSATTQPASPALPKPENVEGVLKRGALIHRVEPAYPEIARQQNVTGTVILEATLSVDGTVRNIQVVSGPKLLVQAAVNAVRQWRYAPTLLDGKAIETEVAISLVFRLPDGSF